MAAAKTKKTKSEAGNAPGNPKTASGEAIPKQTLDTSHQGDIPINPAAKMDQVMEAGKAKVADVKYRESQAAKEDPPYRGDGVNHAEYMAHLETHEDREKAEDEATGEAEKASK